MKPNRNELEQLAYEVAERFYLYELIQRGYAKEQAEEFILKSGVPEKMYKTYLEQVKRDYGNTEIHNS